jgi:hypothetical protein
VIPVMTQAVYQPSWFEAHQAQLLQFFWGIFWGYVVFRISVFMINITLFMGSYLKTMDNIRKEIAQVAIHLRNMRDDSRETL